MRNALAMVVSCLLAACQQADADGGGAKRSMRDPAELADLTFHLDVTVPAGEELFRCVYAQVPSDAGPVAVRSVESQYTPGSHHLLVYRTDLTDVPYGETGVWDCSEGPWFGLTRGTYYESQRPSDARELPGGIAHVFQPGEVMIVQSHYINTTEAEIDAHVELTLRAMDLADVEVEAGTIYFNNTDIHVPPHAKASASMSCPLPEDIHLALLWSHMHARGVRFVVETDDPAAAAVLGTPLYEEQSWAEPRTQSYPARRDAVLHAGSRIHIRCDYQNDGDRTYGFGSSADADEMCILHGMYWPRTSRDSEQCLIGRSGLQGM